MTSRYLQGSTVCSRLRCWDRLCVKCTTCTVLKILVVKIRLKHFLHDEYDWYRLKLLFHLVVSSLCHYMFRSVVRISMQSGSGHCVCAVMYRSLLPAPISELRVWHSYVTNNVHFVGTINWICWTLSVLCGVFTLSDFSAVDPSPVSEEWLSY